MNWFYLAIAIISEVLATSALKASDGFTRLYPSIVVVIGYGLAFYFLSLTLRTIPVGIAYAVWSGIGVMLISLVGWIIYDQKLDTPCIHWHYAHRRWCCCPQCVFKIGCPLMPSLSRALRWNLLITDIGFLVYWSVTAIGVLPSAWLFKDYQNPILVSWNWSFAPIDLLASSLGLIALITAKQGLHTWRQFALIPVTLTFCAGFMALAFWILRRDFDPLWWLPNLYLAVWPLFFVRQLISVVTRNVIYSILSNIKPNITLKRDAPFRVGFVGLCFFSLGGFAYRP